MTNKHSENQVENKLHLTNLQTRTLVFIILVPTIVYLGLLSRWNVALMIWFCMFVAGIEWTGIKRHLKVELLLLRNINVKSNNSIISNPSPISLSTTTTTSTPTTNVAIEHENLEPSSEQTSRDKVRCLSPICAAAAETYNRPEQYHLPVTKVTLYTFCKHFCWACLSFAAYRSVTCFFTAFSVYFLIFVIVTLTAHNRLEMKVQEAADMLSGPFLTANMNIYNNNNNNNNNDDDNVDGVSNAETHSREKLTSEQNSVNNLELARKEHLHNLSEEEQQRIDFHAMELLMIAEKQPTEQFLDFCLDIFGIMWISGLVYPLFCYSIPVIGIQWLLSATISNFINDAAALLVGKSTRKLRDYFCHKYDCSHATIHIETQLSHKLERDAISHASNDNNNSNNNHRNDINILGKPHQSSAPVYIRWIFNTPHSLYPAISPNKSMEGAIAGVIGCTLSFTLCMYIYQNIAIRSLPHNAFISSHYSCMTVWMIVGVFMGVFGVIDDLLQSLLKRSAHVKDAGYLIPGHGGVLDRVDGLLLVYPLLFGIMNILGSLSGSDITNASRPASYWSFSLSHLFSEAH